MSLFEEQKNSADIGLRSIFGEAPTNINIVGGIASSNSSESHLIVEEKTNEQLMLEKQQMLEKLKEKSKKW